MNFRAKLFSLAAVALALATASSVTAAQTISVNFQGRDGNSAPNPGLLPGEAAGVVAVANWNNVDDKSTTPRAENGTTGPLTDSTGAATAVTLTFAANDSWNNDVDPATITTPNAKMMKGVIKQQGAGTSAKFTFNNVADGQYDVYVYTDSNNDNVALDLADGDNLQTYYTIGTHQFADGAAFVQAKNTSSTGTRDTGNYVKLSSVATYGSPNLTITAKYISGGDGLGIAGIQLVNVGGPAVNTTPATFLTQPISQKFAIGDKLAFSVTKMGPGTFQWFKDNAPILNATNDTYTTGALTAADDGAKFKVVLSNNVNSIPSADATITLSQITAVGFVKAEFYAGAVRADLEDPAFTGAPTRVDYLPSFEAPVNQADNYSQRVSATFIPATSGNYVFFICSDDDSDLFLSTDASPANKKLIAQETSWSNSRQWATTAGGSDITAKRSDQFAGTEWPSFGTITLVAGKSYYIEAVHHEGGGGDDLGVTFIAEGQPDPADGTPSALTGKLIQSIAQDQGIKITITNQPASRTVSELTTTTLIVQAVGTQTSGATPPIFYQWQKAPAASTNFTDIANATAASYATPLLTIADSGTQYRVQLTSIGVAVTSSTAVVTVVGDVAPPAVLFAGSLKNGNNNNTEVTVVFDEPLKDAANATTLANYSLNSGAITAARYVTNSGGINSRQSGVVLTATGITPGTTYTLTVKDVSDTKNNVRAATNIQFTASSYNWISIGGVAEFLPATFMAGTNGFNLVSGGNAFWNTQDDITMVYQEVTGDFDKKAQVEYADPASNWARSGISARESLNNGAETTDVAGANPASRYQMIISDPTTKFDGTAANNQYETNRRQNTGGATSSSNGGGTPLYPNSWVRLKRIGQAFSMFYSSNAVHWVPLGGADFGDPAFSDTPLPAKLFVGPTYGPENNNIATDVTDPRRGLWATRIRNYSDTLSAQKPRGSATYAIGLNFGANENGARMSSSEVAGVDVVAQANWNNLIGANSDTTGPVSGIVAEKAGASAATTVTVEWTSPNTWESTGRGEENNQLVGSDHTLMTGYLDTGGASTTPITISNIPTDLTSGGYDVYVYLLGGVPGRGGGYRIVDTAGTVLKDYVLAQGAANPTNFVEVPQIAGSTNYGAGTHIIFKGLKASTIKIEASTENGLAFGGTPRAPINAVQLVVPPASAPAISVTRTASGISITYEGKLQSSDAVNGPYTDVAGATSPFAVTVSGSAKKFYRATR